MGGATTVLGAVLGYAFGGPFWMCAGAALGWLLDVVIAVCVRDTARRDAEAIRVRVSKLRHSLEDGFAGVVSRLPPGGFYNALVDAQSLEHFEALHARGLRTAEEWLALDATRWSLLRRRLIQVHGLNPELVDEAKDALRMWNPESLPETEKELLEAIKQQRALEEWAWNSLDKHGRVPRDAGGHSDTPAKS